MTRSIRASLLSGTVIAAIVIIAIAGTAVYKGVRSALVNRLDRQLANEAHLLASAVRVAPDGIELAFDELDVGRSAWDGGKAYLQVWSGADSVLYRSPSMGGGDLSPIDRHPNNQILSWMKGAPHVRAVSLVFRPSVDKDDTGALALSPDVPRPDVRLALARSLADIDALLEHLRELLAGVGFLTVIAMGGVLAVVIRRGTRPLDTLADEISLLNAAELSSRISMASTPREITPVVDQLNDLLVRLENAFHRESTFSADIAHELRTPLAGLRSTIEVIMTRPRPAAEYQATLIELLEIIRRLQAMVERLLYLGRLESGQIEVEERTVDLGEVARASWKLLVEQTARRELDVQWNLKPDAVATTDPLLLEVAIRNLLENAVEYSSEGGHVAMEVEKEGDRSVFRVVNDGSQVAQGEVAGLTDRFSRADRSRAATGIHYGLGLAIVSRIASVLHGSLVLQSSVGGEFKATLSLENGHCGIAKVASGVKPSRSNGDG